MKTTSTKKQLLAEFSRIAKAVANPVRLEIIDYLAQGECTVEFLAAKCGQKIANVSQHLRLLAAAGLVTQRRAGTFIHYRTTRTAEALVEHLASAAGTASPKVQQIVQQHFHAQAEVCKKSPAQVIAGAQRGELLIIDVRPDDEYYHGHIAGARSLPLTRLGREWKQLPRSREIVAYCRGPWCALAVEAVSLLRQKGFAATRLELGFPQWKAKKLPVADRVP